MTHEEILNKMLMGECPRDVEVMDSGWNLYEFEGHCQVVRIIARYNDNGTFTIHDVDFGGDDD